MKKITVILVLLFVICSGQSFSQAQKESVAPVKPALLVIDIQNQFLPMIPERDRTMGLAYINNYIDIFRSHGCPIIRIYHEGKEFGPKQGTDQFEFPTTVKILPDDPKVIKNYPDGFNKTDLDKVLRENGCNTLFLVGLSAVGCVLATYIGANNHDYKVFMIEDAIMSHDSDFTNQIENIFGAVNYDVVKIILEQSGK
ncbi:MAG: cysteine hydrolase [Bacteroidales bacterium]|nr:cysteine hydrolase [Bacteroidales bacterium]